MSIRIMSAVWAASQQKQNALLLMLAIADHANDDGIAWPGMDSLAQKTRVSRSTIKRMIKLLAKSGEITIERGQGRGHTHRYRINLDRLKGVTLTPFIPFEKGSNSTQKGSNSTIKGVTAMTPEPPLTINEPPPSRKRAPGGGGGGEPSEQANAIYSALVFAGANGTRNLRTIAARLATVEGLTPESAQAAFIAARDKAKAEHARNPVGVALALIGAEGWQPAPVAPKQRYVVDFGDGPEEVNP